MLYELIARLAVVALMALIIQFNPGDWLHGFGITQQKIDVLAVDLVGVGAKFARVAGFDIKQVPRETLASSAM
jgi:hypothetical protein